LTTAGSFTPGPPGRPERSASTTSRHPRDRESRTRRVYTPGHDSSPFGIGDGPYPQCGRGARLPLANSQGDGSLGRNTERTASFWNTDLSLLKRFYIFGDRQLVLRADAFNAFNQDSYGMPTVSLSSASFGRNGNSWGRRVVTLSAKFVW
jgi:hypothetical protein